MKLMQSNKMTQNEVSRDMAPSLQTLKVLQASKRDICSTYAAVHEREMASLAVVHCIALTAAPHEKQTVRQPSKLKQVPHPTFFLDSSVRAQPSTAMSWVAAKRTSRKNRAVMETTSAFSTLQPHLLQSQLHCSLDKA